MTKKIRVFVSHAAPDKALVDEVVDLFQLTINVPTDEIFCSSLEGMDIPPGKSFLDYIKEQIQSPEVVVVRLTPNYLASLLCLAERRDLGADSQHAPILVPPLTYSIYGAF